MIHIYLGKVQLGLMLPDWPRQGHKASLSGLKGKFCFTSQDTVFSWILMNLPWQLRRILLLSDVSRSEQQDLW